MTFDSTIRSTDSVELLSALNSYHQAEVERIVNREQDNTGKEDADSLHRIARLGELIKELAFISESDRKNNTTAYPTAESNDPVITALRAENQQLRADIEAQNDALRAQLATLKKQQTV